MPFDPLFGRLKEKTEGRIIDAERGIALRRPSNLSAAKWRCFRARTDVQKGWIDYTVEF